MYKTIIALIFLNINFIALLAQNKTDAISAITSKNIYSRHLDENRSIIISLPQSYEDGGQDYPVLYLLDGEFLPIFYEAVAATNYLNYNEDTPEFIIIAVATSVNRDKYFIPSDDIDDEQTDVKKFQKFLINELHPYVEWNYRVTDFKILFGASNGGLFSIYTLLTQPKSFDAIIASSSTIGHCSELIKKISDVFIENKSYINKAIYLNYGGTDTHLTTDYTPAFFKNLKEKLPVGYPITLDIFGAQGHVPFGSIFEGLKYITAQSGLED